MVRILLVCHAVAQGRSYIEAMRERRQGDGMNKGLDEDYQIFSTMCHDPRGVRGLRFNKIIYLGDHMKGQSHRIGELQNQLAHVKIANPSLEEVWIKDWR